MMGEPKDPIPIINYNTIFQQMHIEYVNTFENVFKVVENSTLRCRNQDIPAFNQFITNWYSYFRDNEILLGQLTLNRAGIFTLFYVNN